MDENIFLKNLKKSSSERDVPNITEENACFLRTLLSLSGATSLLEVGTANGYSTLHFAFEIRKKGGRITTIEFSPASYEEAKKNFSEMGVQDIITPLFGNALEILPILKEKYDFIFIDAMKKNTKRFLELCFPLLKSGGYIVIDDVIKFKHKMLDLYEYVKEKEIPHCIIPIDSDDGVMLIVPERK